MTQKEYEKKLKDIQLFRYGVIAELANPYLIVAERISIIKEKASREYQIPYSTRTTIGIECIRKWLSKYRKYGIDGLLPKFRDDRGHSRSIPQEDKDIIISALKADLYSTARAVAKRLKQEEKIKKDITSSSLSRLVLLYGLKRKNRISKAQLKIDSIYKQHEWLRRLLQGKVHCEELLEDISIDIPGIDIKELHNCIINNSLRYRNRAIIVLGTAIGIVPKVISEYLYISDPAIRKINIAYNERGINWIVNGDKDKRIHKHEKIEYIEKLFSIFHSPPSLYGYNRTTWIQSELKEVMMKEGFFISKDGIKRIIDNAGYRYRKARTVLTSNDPDYKDKLNEIKKILSNLGSNEKFFSIDEYGPFAIKIYGGKSLVAPGTKKTVPQWQKNKGSLICTAALELSTNQITHFYSYKKNTDEMIKLLNNLIKQYSDEETIYFSWDAASWHASKKLYKAVEEINSSEYRNKNTAPIIKLAPLPSCAQFLNVIESVFSGMARAIIHNSNYQSADECKTAIDKYFAERNKHFLLYPKRAGNKIWGKERVPSSFSECNNCKDPRYR